MQGSTQPATKKNAAKACLRSILQTNQCSTSNGLANFIHQPPLQLMDPFMHNEI